MNYTEPHRMGLVNFSSFKQIKKKKTKNATKKGNLSQVNKKAFLIEDSLLIVTGDDTQKLDLIFTSF